ncbi:MAG: protein kinase [Candidatus Thorarchaeota archaeon]
MVDHEADNDRTRTHVVLTKGTMVSHYRIVEKIGAGGMGEVYLADDTKLKRKVALKFLPGHLSGDPDFKTRFVREAEATAKLNHPNIITIYEVSEYNGRPYFAMELVEGQSLRDLAKGKDLSVDKIIELAIQICDGLGAAHDSKVVHRDIKPSNIVIDSYGRPKILDFGLATIQGGEHLTKTGSTLGTVRYMSPEQVQGQEVDQRSDLFSLGVVLYELISGRTPFEKENDAATLKAISQDNPEPLARYKSDVPDELQRTISKLLEKDLSMRYQTAGGVLSDLKRLTTPTQSSTAQVPARKKPSWPVVVSGLVIIMILITAGIKFLPGVKVEWQATPVEERVLLAVLPFENIGAPEDEYFADGITGEITSKVGVLDGLGVISRTSMLQFKGTTKRISEIGTELDVDFLLGGTIRWDKSGSVDKIRITPELTRVSDETTVWTDNIERDMAGIFDVQSEIATSIAEALGMAILAGGREALDYRPTENLDAYDYYLRARTLIGPGSMLQSLRLMDKAIELDSSFALAYVSKSIIHSIIAFFGESGFSEHTKPARQAYQRAFEIQPDLAEAHMARGVYYNLIDRDYDKALREFEIARQGPVEEASVLNAISMVKLRQGRWREAIELSQQALKLDPQSPGPQSTILWASWFSHQYEMALEAIEQEKSLGVPGSDAYFYEARILISMGAQDDEIQQTLDHWLDKGMSTLGGITGPVLLDFLRERDRLPDLDSLITDLKFKLPFNPDPDLYFYTGLLYRYNGDQASSHIYLDSARIVYENRLEKARSDTTGRFEIFPPNHEDLERLAMVYSMTGRHELALEQVHLSMESMPIEACHW